MSRIFIAGAGAWGTALAIHCARLGHEVSVWARHLDEAGKRLPGFPLPETVRRATCAVEADLSLIAVPVQTVREVLGALRPKGPVVMCCKGLELGTFRLPLEILADIMPDSAGLVLTGPNFAHEVAAGLPAASVVAGADAEAACAVLAGSTFRLYANADAVGAQLGGAAKNVVALAAGAVMGAGLGENARAALVTRGLAEIGRLVVALGGRAETVAGLSGLGDLMLSCAGDTSRNFALGYRLGRGMALREAMKEGGPVVEAVWTAPALLGRAKGVDVPVIEAVADFLAGRIGMPDAAARLLARPLRQE